MTKRKRTTSKTPDDSDAEAGAIEPADAARDDMVHVTPDLLAGSLDVFAPKAASTPPAPESEPAPAEAPEVVSEPIVDDPSTAEPHADADPDETGRPMPDPQAFEPAPSTPPPFVTAVPHPAQRRRAGSSAALGVVLVVLGVFALGVVLLGVDLTQYGWPLFVIIPG